jgi:hypothetical protein
LSSTTRISAMPKCRTLRRKMNMVFCHE